MAHESQTEAEMKHYGYTGVEFEWGFALMLMFGVLHEYRKLSVAIGPLFLEWTW